jgi:hypothetical protein
MGFELGGVQIPFELAHLKHHTTGALPVMVLRPSTTGEWSLWRRPEAAREQRLRADYLKRLSLAGLTELEVERAYTQMKAHEAAAKDRGRLLGELAARKAAGEDVDALIDGIDQEGKAAAAAWGEPVALVMRLEDVQTDREPETLETTRHTFEYVLSCVVRIDNVFSQGRPILWDDAELLKLGTTKAAVLEELLGPGDEAIHVLYQMATKIRFGLSEQEKKA